MRLLDLPGIMRDRLGMRVIDLMTYTMPELTAAYVDRFRHAADAAGCTISNLKMNQNDLEIAADEPAERRRAMAEYKRTIDLAERLGCRWVRPMPGTKRADMKVRGASYRELLDYSAPKGITLLENTRWLSDDPKAIPAVLQTVGAGLAAAPGAWSISTKRWKALSLVCCNSSRCCKAGWPRTSDNARRRSQSTRDSAIPKSHSYSFLLLYFLRVLRALRG